MLPILNMLNQIGSTEVVKAYGLPALIAELAEEGISQNQVLREAGLSTLSDDLTIHERTALLERLKHYPGGRKPHFLRVSVNVLVTTAPMAML